MGGNQYEWAGISISIVHYSYCIAGNVFTFTDPSEAVLKQKYS